MKRKTMRKVTFGLAACLLAVAATTGASAAAAAEAPDVRQLRQELREQLRNEFGSTRGVPATGVSTRLPAAGVATWRQPLRGELGAPTAATSTGPKTVVVDCSKPGASIQKALETKGEPLTVQISGICVENVQVHRDRVNLVGTNPATDGIRAAGNGDPRESALIVRNARRVRIENLTIQGAAWTGLRIIDSYDVIEVVNCRIEDNGIRGSSVISSDVFFTDTVFTANGTAPPGFVRGGLVVAFGGRASCTRCTLENNPAPGANTAVAAFGGTEAFFRDSHLEGSNGLVGIDYASTGTSDGSTIAAGFGAILLDTYASATAQGTPFDGALLVFEHSGVRLQGSTQLGAPFPSFIEDNSSLVATAVNLGDPPVLTPTTLTDDLLMIGFSNAQIENGSTVAGVLCFEASDAYCDGTETKTGSSCAACP